MFYPGHRFNPKKPFYPYEELKVIVQNKGIVGLSAYADFWQSLSDSDREHFPCNPNTQYREYSFVDFFGYAVSGKRPVHTYEKLKSLVAAAGLKDLGQYRRYRQGLLEKESRYWPRDPAKAYPSQYSHFDFFGAYEPGLAGPYDFAVIMAKVKKLKIRNSREYFGHRKGLSPEEKRHWPYNPWSVYPEMKSKTFFYSDERLLERWYSKLKEAMKRLGIDTSEKYKSHRGRLVPGEKKFWPSHPEEVFKGLYVDAFYGFRDRRTKKRGYLFLKDRCREFGWKSLSEYWAYRERLSLSERRHWPRVPWEYHGKTRNDFFGSKKNQKDFYSLAELQRLLLGAKALYFKDYEELRAIDPRIPSKPDACRWFSGWDELFPYRRDFSIIRSGNLFFYSVSELRRQLKSSLIFNNNDYLAWRSLLPAKEARLCPIGLYSVYGNWSWRCPELLVFESAAEVSRAAKKLGLSDREGYLAAVKDNRRLPARPEEFFDWPSKIERFTEGEAWEIFLGVFNENTMNRHVKDPFFDRGQALRDIAAAGAENNLAALTENWEAGYSFWERTDF